MDFHTMVSNFKRQVLKEEEEKEELEELSRHARKMVKRYIKDGTPGRHTPKYSFDHLFGGQETMRLIVPLQASIRIGGIKLFKRIVDQGWTPSFTTKTIKQKKQRLAADGGGEYEEEFDAPVLTMVKSEERTIPAGPRKGEVITSTKKMSLGKLVQRLGTEEDKAWWAENQSDVQTGEAAVENMQNYFLKPYMNDFKGVGDVRPVVVISRHPMDVARMSDFSMTRSCHSESGGYFNCAIHESKGHGLIAFLVKSEDVEEITKRINRGDDEVFGDRNIGFDGPEPIARVRLYKLYNEMTGEEFALPEARVYGLASPDFLPTVRTWARENQKNIWSGDTDGEKLDIGALSPDDWARLGGSYADAEQSAGGELGDLLADLFKDTPLEERAKEFELTSYAYEDPYDEDNEAEREIDEANERLGIILRNAEGDSDNVAIHAEIEEGWDADMPWYLEGHCFFSVHVPLTEEEVDKIPVEGWGDRRELIQEFVSIFENYEPFSEYDGWEVDYDVEEAYGPVEAQLVIRVSGSFRPEAQGMEQVSEFEYWAKEVIENMDNRIDSMRGAVRAKLIEAGIKPPGPYETAVEELVDNTEYENFQILYDEDDPGDGIDIILKSVPGKKDIVSRIDITEPHRAFRVVDSFPAFDSKGNNVSRRFMYFIKKGNRTSALGAATTSAKIRLNFKKMIKQAEKAAEKQVALPLGDKYKKQAQPIVIDQNSEIYVVADRVPFKRAGSRRPVPRTQMSDEDVIAHDKFPIDIAYRFELKIKQDITTENYEQIKVFLNYLDNNLDKLEDSIREEAAKLYQRASDDMDDNIYGRSRYDGQSRPTTPAADAAPEQIGEAKIRAAIRKVIRKHLLKEQEEKFQTRMFQINLRLQVDKSVGGGIEQKLNRIRAIDGVTVVGHDEGEKVGGLRVIEARVKFHPESDSLRPMSYVQQVLVPNINSSRTVPGVKVIEIVSGTLKRLDK